MNCYSERRKKVFDLLPDHSILMITSGTAPYKQGDARYPFFVNRNFFYLTGLQRENMTLVMLKEGKRQSETVFIEPYNELLAKWVGGRMMPDQVKEISGIQTVDFVENLKDSVGSYLNWYGNEEMSIYSDFDQHEYAKTTDSMNHFINKVKEKYPWVTVKNATKILTTLRMVKEPCETEDMKNAIHVTNLGIQSMWEHVHPGINESELHGWFELELYKNQCEDSFDAIVAGGSHATVLHYGDNNSVVNDNELVLIDLGAAYNHYCADISRTFPANGTFTKRQKEIYNIVLGANKHIIEYAKCGMTLRDLNDETIRYYEEHLPATGLLEKGTVHDYYFHSVSHMLGLETHDVSLMGTPLQPGHVFTVEPGLYIAEEGIGIRIEDDVLMTEDGAVNLSSEIMKEVEDIERFIQKR